MHLFRVHTGAQASQHAEAHRLTDGLAAHAVEVVDEVDDQREPAAVALFHFLYEFRTAPR